MIHKPTMKIPKFFRFLQPLTVIPQLFAFKAFNRSQQAFHPIDF
jgi:hypothetical protein